MIPAFLALLALLPAARAENTSGAPANPATAPAVAGTVLYELRDLKPGGITQYAGGGDVVRQYFDFQNDQGRHHVIYEEVANAPAARTVPALRQFAGSGEMRCAMDVECKAKAFCLESCRQMYYEVSNAVGDALSPERDNCRIAFFTCDRAPASAAAPAAQPAASPPASPAPAALPPAR